MKFTIFNLKHNKLNTVLSMMLGILIFGFFTLGLPTKSESLSGSQFNPGHIVSDSVFYDGDSMTEGQIQSFLNAKVPVCDTNGTQPYAGTTRAAYGASNGYPAPYTCLKDYAQSVSTITNSGSDLCTGSISGGTKSSARIIYEVAKACDVNPKVLIVLLQKEQSLITDDWPWSIQYRSATGYGCPDTAPCDSEYYGFFNQVYQAAKAYKRYRANPTNYNYRANRNNTILWHPNAGCGTSNVYIQNQATAGLYIYTPYRPNQAALNNLYGTGNSCSSYGNRNFWRMFNDWFGSTLQDYASAIRDIRVYSDSGRTNELLSIPQQSSGQTLYFTVEAENTGYKEWDDSIVRIGTRSPYNRHSDFCNGTWLSCGRPTQLEEPSIAPGEVGTFEFSMTMPSQNDTYEEVFNLIAEGKAWLPGGGFKITLTVNTPYNGHITSLQTFSDAARTQPISTSFMTYGQKIYVSAEAKNTGSQTWSSSTFRIGTSNPENRTSDFQDDSWFSPARPSVMNESSVTPGQTASFDFTITAPSISSTYSENFKLLAEGIAWIPNARFGFNIDIVESTPGRISGNQRIYTRQLLQSRNGEYRLVMRESNLVLYSPTRAIWLSPAKPGTEYANAVLQNGGNLVIYDNNGHHVWNLGTSGNPNSRLVLQNSGNLILYDASNKAVWTSGTAGQP